MNIRWNQVAIAAAIGFLLGAVFSDLYRMHFRPHWPPPPHMSGGPMEMFNRELELSKAQKQEVSAIFEKYRPEMDKAMEANRAEMEKVRGRMKAELKNVLDPDQLKKLESMEKEFGQRGPRGPMGDRPPMGRRPF